MTYQFVQVNTNILEMEISDNAFRVYCALKSFCFNSRKCFPTIQTLADKLHKSERTIQRAINELISKELVVKFERLSNGKNQSNTYYLMSGECEEREDSKMDNNEGIRSKNIRKEGCHICHPNNNKYINNNYSTSTSTLKRNEEKVDVDVEKMDSIINSITDDFELSCATYVKRYYKIILSNTDIKYYKVGFKMVKAEEVKEAIKNLSIEQLKQLVADITNFLMHDEIRNGYSYMVNSFWNLANKKNYGTKVNQFNNFKQQTYDWDELEKELLAN